MLAAFLATFAFRWLALADFDNDHFDHVARAHQVLLGDWPVRDFVDPGLPLTILLSAAVHAVLPAPYLAEALIFIPGFALAAALSFRLASIASGSILLASGAVLLQVAMFPRSYSYPKLLVYALALTVGWLVIDRLNTVRLAALAGVTALAYYFRHDHGLYIGLASVALLAVHTWQDGVRRGVRTVAVYAAMVVLFVLPHLIYVQAAAGVPAYLSMLREFAREEARVGDLTLPAFHVDPALGLWDRPDPPLAYIRWAADLEPETRAQLERQYSLRPVSHSEGTTWRYEVGDLSAANLAALRGHPNVEDTHDFDRLTPSVRWRETITGWLRPGPGLLVVQNSASLLFWVFWLGPFAAVALGRGASPAMANAAPKLAMLVTMAVCVNVGFLRNPLAARLPDAAVPHTILWAWLIAACWHARPRLVPRAVVRGLVTAAAVLVIAAVGWLFEPLEQLQRTRVPEGIDAMGERWRHVSRELREDLGGPMPNGSARALVPFFRYVRRCTAPDDRLLVVGYAPEAYVFARRGFAGGQLIYLGEFHASPAEQALTVERLRRQDVPFIIVPAGGGKADFRQTYDTIWAEIEPRYVFFATVAADDGSELEVLVERSRLATAVPGPSNEWPCLVSTPAVVNRSGRP